MTIGHVLYCMANDWKIIGRLRKEQCICHLSLSLYLNIGIFFVFVFKYSYFLCSCFFLQKSYLPPFHGYADDEKNAVKTNQIRMLTNTFDLRNKSNQNPGKTFCKKGNIGKESEKSIF